MNVNNSTLTQEQMQQIAETAQGAHWALARSTGNFDGPPWQIMPKAQKARYVQAACMLWEYPEASPLEFYRFVAPADEQAPTELNRVQLLHYQIFRNVVEAFRTVLK